MTIPLVPWPGLGGGEVESVGFLSLSLVPLSPTGPECASLPRLYHSSAPQGPGLSLGWWGRW